VWWRRVESLVNQAATRAVRSVQIAAVPQGICHHWRSVLSEGVPGFGR